MPDLGHDQQEHEGHEDPEEHIIIITASVTLAPAVAAVAVSIWGR